MKGLHRFKAGFDPSLVDRIRATVDAELLGAGVTGAFAYSLLTVADEICCNVLEHSQASWLEIEIEARPDWVRLIVRDDGQAFDPTAPGGIDGIPDASQVRKLGLYMVGKLSDYCHYRRVEGSSNELTLEITKQAGQ